MNSPKPRLTEGPVGRHLVDMTVPVLFGITTMMAQSLIDTWFIGRVGDAELAAYGFSFPILMIVTSVAIGLGAGTSSVVARAIGADDHRRARRLSTDSLLLSFLITAGVSVVGVLDDRSRCSRFLGAPDELMPLIRGFMTILYAGRPIRRRRHGGYGEHAGDGRHATAVRADDSCLGPERDPGPDPDFRYRPDTRRWASTVRQWLRSSRGLRYSSARCT